MASKLYKRILIATDGKEYTKNSIDHGIEQAKNSGAKLYAFYVIDTVAYASVPMDSAWESELERLKQEGKAATKYVTDKAQAMGLEADRVIVEGRPADEIINYAENNSIDLIIMGTSGKNWWNRFLQGSVVEKVVHNSKIPVLIVHGERVFI